MRLPRHDIPLRLPAEPPDAAISADEALLESPGVRLWVASAPAVVVGVGLHHRLAAVVDLQRCERAGVQIIERRAGGGALLLDGNVLCGAVAMPTSSISSDVTESYRWLGDLLLGALGIDQARRVEVPEARADVAGLRQLDDPVAKILLTTCYGALSPHEIVVENKKLVGLAQIRRRETALFQFGVLLRDQSPLADYLNVPNDDTREGLRVALERRTTGLTAVTDRSASAVAAAIADAMPSAA
jgi:lipoate-protein ligase A